MILKIKEDKMMAMEMNGNLPDFSVQMLNSGSYAAQSVTESRAANSTKKNETKKTSETAGSSKIKSRAEYVNELAKLVPSAELKVGNSFSTAKNGITLTINPQLLEKMQNDPEKEKEMKELIGGVESAVNMLEGINKASGWTVVFKHCYIDENGKFRSIAYLRNDYMLNMSDKLREERRKNSEELIEKTKEKVTEKREELEQLLKEKMAASKDGIVYLYDTDMKAILEAAKEDATGKPKTKEQVQVGANLDLQA